MTIVTLVVWATRGTVASQQDWSDADAYGRLVQEYRGGIRNSPCGYWPDLLLGRVHSLLHDERWQNELETAIAKAPDAKTRYLAHLFLGAVAERENRLEAARDEYSAALEIGNAWQTAAIALSHIEAALGQKNRATVLLRRQLTAGEIKAWTLGGNTVSVPLILKH